MKHSYICNTELIIDWEHFLLNLHQEEKLPNWLAKTPDELDNNVYYHRLLKNANINWDNVNWTDYNLENSKTGIAEKFSKIVNSKMLRCFISKIDPGISVVTHWDEGDVKFYDKADVSKISRYTCFIQDPKPGHMFAVDSHCFYYMPKGVVYKWANHTDFHSAANTGFESYYLFHFLGEDY
jgi:hypothetical protein